MFTSTASPADQHPVGLGGYVVEGLVGGWAVAGITVWDPKGTPVLVPVVDGGNTARGAALRWGLASHSYRFSGAGYGNALVVNGSFVNGGGRGVLNAAAFSRTPDCSMGNSPVMFPDLRNPGDFATEASILKKYYLSDNQSRYVEVRIEAQDILNHPIFGTIIADPDSPTFGGINGKTGQRVMQVGARYFFDQDNAAEEVFYAGTEVCRSWNVDCRFPGAVCHRSPCAAEAG